MSTDRRTKRLLSPGSVKIENPEDKRLKGNFNIEEDFISIPQAKMDPVEEEKDLTLADIKRYMDIIFARVKDNGKDIKNLATKKYISEMNDQMIAQGAEIDQLRGEVKTLKTSVKEINENLDLYIAQKVDRMSRTAGIQTGRPSSNMASTSQNKLDGRPVLCTELSNKKKKKKKKKHFSVQQRRDEIWSSRVYLALMTRKSK